MFKSMKIGAKLITGFAIVATILFGVGLYAFITLGNIKDDMDMIINNRYVKVKNTYELEIFVFRNGISMRNIILDSNLSHLQAMKDDIQNRAAMGNVIIDSLESTTKSEKGKALLKNVIDMRTDYGKMRDIIVNLGMQNKNAEATGILLGDMKVITDKYVNSILELQEFNTDAMQKVSVDAMDGINTANTIIVIVVILSVLLSIVIALVITRMITRPINEAVVAADSIADGNMNVKLDIDKKDEIGVLMRAMKKMSESIKGMVGDANHLAESAISGKLDVRADANKYNGEFKNLIKGLNDTLDAVIGPLNVAAEYIDRISKGDIPHTITDNYNGDFNEIKMNLNQCMSAIRLLVDDTTLLAKAAEDGKLSVRADANKHQGDFRKVIQGINNTLELIIQPVEETVKVIKEMAEGNLAVRVSGNFMGDHAVLKDSLNETLDSLPLQETMSVMQEMADGNLTVRMNGTYKGDSLKLKNAVNDTIEELNEILGNVSTTVEEVTRAAMQVSDTSTALSQGATEQAASLEEITSSMGEIGSQTRLNAENSNLANSLAHEARDAAEKGNSEMGQLTDAMNEINESSKNISKIIKVIDEIAFQTNLLALNAAVEAARAGRHGKGFAVVAEEVRNLAARSATAAKETSEMIENSIKTVERGTGLVSKTGDALSEIQNSSVKVADIIGEITTSSNEQAQGISQINEGLTQIDKVTQTNTASAEESASAAEELSSQSSQLRDLVGKFRLSGNAGHISSSPRPKQLNRSGSNSRALPPSSSRRTPVREEDLYSMVDDSIRDSERLGHKPEDIIRLDEDDFGRY